MRAQLFRSLSLLSLLAFIATPAIARDVPPKFTGPAPAAGDADASGDTYRQLNLFSEVFGRVREDYVKEVPDKQLVESAVNGMLTALDPHSGYMNTEDFKNMQVQTRGEFGGLGIEVTMDNNVIKVVSPIDDTPAAKANIQPGDLIIEIDNTPVLGLTLNQAVEKLRGRPNSKVKLTISRNKGEPFDVTLMRDIIKIKSVKSDLKKDVGYIRITQFNEQTDVGVREALKKFQSEQGDKLLGYVIDMRNNPGGLLDQSISTAGLFLNSGDIAVSTKGRHPEDSQVFKTKGEPVANPKLPIVVLINGGSASAAEIVAGALQDHKRAVLMGVPSFGKGSVQTVSPIPGYGAIRLTTAYYYTPSGRSIQATGIKPDIEVAQEKTDGAPDSRMAWHEADLPGALDNPTGAAAVKSKAEAGKPERTVAPDKVTPAKPVESETLNDKQNKDKPDYQLSRAIDLVRGISLVGNRTK